MTSIFIQECQMKNVTLNAQQAICLFFFPTESHNRSNIIQCYSAQYEYYFK